MLLFLSLHSWSVFKNSRLWIEKVPTVWLEFVSIVNDNQFYTFTLIFRLNVKHFSDLDLKVERVLTDTVKNPEQGTDF